MKRFILFAALLVTVPLFSQEWPQWALNAKHTGQVSVVGQALNQNLVNIVYDPLVPQEMAASGGDLLAHYQAPLVDGNNVYMVYKDGVYHTQNYGTQKWGETKYSWQGGTLVTQWQFASDWDPPGSANDFWEPVFHPALANGFLYVPGIGGSIVKVDKSTGVAVTRINPFPTINGGTTNTIFTASPITVDSSGNLFYNAIQFHDAVEIFHNDVIDSWLVKVTPGDGISTVSYSVLTAGAPLGTDQCVNAFPTNADGTLINGPWPPSPTAVPGSVVCGTQRPGINIAPAIASDGTIYTVSRAHLISREAFLIAVNPNLTQKWIRTLRNRFNDGCGVTVANGGTLPPNGSPGGCRAGANFGVDPATNSPGGGRVLDDSSSSPVIASDGSILYGAYTRYNYAQGHLMHFAANGNYLGAYKFGWDVTPGIRGSSIVTKDNHYGMTGSYCNDPAFCPDDNSDRGTRYPEAYFVTQLDSNLNVQWSYQNTNTQSCTRQPDGSVTCVSDHPNGFEWCVNAFVIDANGNVYANSEDGNLFKIPQNAVGVTRIFQQLALGAAYTPTSMDSSGRIYSQNAGHLFVAGN
ncbi:MAG TPA: hypothetical protein VHX14_00065 [Thermoanaerobaculia bacterium]|nr:hypothetical protein [Thermoanaerobaculia bacterium]